jgi:hypothetical protein
MTFRIPFEHFEASKKATKMPDITCVPTAKTAHMFFLT